MEVSSGEFDLLQYLESNEVHSSLDPTKIDEFIVSELKIPFNLVGEETIEFKETSSSSSESDLKLPCPVCIGGLVGKHLYYGARVCISCRGFFRRSVQSKQCQLFQCINNEFSSCVIDSKNRKSCKYCRFQKCLESGMKMNWVLSERERNARVMKFPPKKFVHLEMTFSVQEQSMLEKNATLLFQRTNEKYLLFFKDNPDMLIGWLGKVYQSEVISSQTLKIFEQLDEQVLKNNAFELEGFNGLTNYDKMTLIMKNYDTMYGLLISLCNTVDDLKDWLTELCALDFVPSRVHAIIASFLSRKPPNKKWLIEEWYLPSYGGNALDQKSKDTLLEANMAIKKWLNANDRIMMTLVVMIFILNPGTLNLEQPNEVQHCHDKCVWQLHRYLKKKCGTESAKYLHNILMTFSHAETVNLIIKRSKI